MIVKTKKRLEDYDVDNWNADDVTLLFEDEGELHSIDQPMDGQVSCALYDCETLLHRELERHYNAGKLNMRNLQTVVTLLTQTIASARL